MSKKLPEPEVFAYLRECTTCGVRALFSYRDASTGEMDARCSEHFEQSKPKKQKPKGRTPKPGAKRMTAPRKKPGT